MFIKLKNSTDKEIQRTTQQASLISTAMPDQEVLSGTELAHLKPTIISEGSVFEGNLSYRGSVHLDGKFKGIIKAEKVIMGKKGAFNGTMEAKQVVIFGNVKGQVKSQQLSIKTGAKVAARLEYQQIDIQYGASTMGELVCIKK